MKLPSVSSKETLMSDSIQPAKAIQFIRLQRITEKTALSRATVYRMIHDGVFPKPMKVGRCSVWLESDLDQWIQCFLEAHGRNG
ncbi:MAG: helix-turn-helix transcriptional regulator [Pseudomonas sp.]